MKYLTINSRQNGAVMVEFAIIGLLFFVILFSIIEFSRLMFVWNAVADATRLGARAASVCIIGSADIANITRSDPAGSGSPLLPNDIDASKIRVRYLNADGGEVLNPDPADVASFMQIRYVEVSIINYEYELFLPDLSGICPSCGFDGTITLPPFTTTRPREALGIIPVVGAPSAANQGC